MAESVLPSDSSLHLSVVTSLGELLELRTDWIALDTAAGSDLPFQTWEWVVAWWTHLREDSAGVRDHLRICVLRDATGQIAAIAPFVLTERPAMGPARVRYLQLVGADPNITEIRKLLCRPGFEEHCYAVLRAYFANRRDEWDWIAWGGFAPPTAASDTFVHAPNKSAFVLRLAPDWLTMRSQLRRNVKESLRKCYNSLRRDALSYSLETISEPQAIREALNDFFRLHAQRATLTSGPRHGDVFASQEARAFLLEACRRLAHRHVTRVFRLRVSGKVVAVRIGFQMGPTLYLYYSGWDLEYARYSVMTTLLAEIIQDAIRQGVANINLSTGSDVSKTRWRPEEVLYPACVELPPEVAARVRFYAFQALRHATGARLTRSLLPRALVRRSEPRPRLPFTRMIGQSFLRLHALAPAALAVIVVDLLDGSFDHHLDLLRAAQQLLH